MMDGTTIGSDAAGNTRPGASAPAGPASRREQVVDAVPTARTILIESIKGFRKKPPSRPRLPDLRVVLPKARLDERRIGTYARTCGFTEAQGVPLTYPHMLAFPLHMMLMLRPDFPFPVVGLVHLNNAIRQHARLRIGDTLQISAEPGRFVAHDKGQAFTIETRATRGGELVWESTSTYLRIGVHNPQGTRADPQPTGPAPLSTRGRFRITPALAKRYAAVSGDRNPIHTSKIGARLLGFRRPIIHGMWSKARSLAALLPQSPIERAEVDVAFKTPAFLPGTVLLLVSQAGDDTIFDLRDGNAEKPHLRGVLRADAA